MAKDEKTSEKSNVKVDPVTKEPLEEVKRKGKTYYAPTKKYSFQMNVLDKYGKPLIQKDHKGNEKFSNGKPIFIKKTLSFECISRVPGKFLCYYQTSNKEIIAHLDKLADEPGTIVMTEKVYQKSRNAEAFEKQIELDAVKGENMALKRKVEALENELGRKGK